MPNSKLNIIEESAFSDTKISTIIIPKSVTKICKSAFIDCSNLKQIHFEDNSNHREIESMAFGRTVIETISIPPKLEKIDLNAFCYCEKLETTIFNRNIDMKSIKFKNCNAVLQVNKYSILNSSLNNKQIIGDQGLSYSFNNKTAEIVGFDNKTKHILVPISVKNGLTECNITAISDKVFNDSIIKSIHFQSDSHLLKIGIRSFYKSSIVFITIPASVKEINDEAFSMCDQLNKVIIPKDSQLEIIGKYAFSSTKISEFTLPRHVVEIKEGAFAECSNLNSFTFEKDSELKKICKNAFKNIKVYILSIPKSVIELENGWLNESKLDFLDVHYSNPIYKNSDNFIIGKTDPNGEYDELVLVLDNYNDALTIPQFIKKIDDFCFYKFGIESITIPQHVTKIGQYSFSSCPELKQVVFAENSELQIIGSHAFSGSKIETIIIPPHVTEIQSFAFSDCEQLKQIAFMDNSELHIIHMGAFQKTKIGNIKIPQHVKKICQDAFQHSYLDIIDFPENSELETIEDFAFGSTFIKYIAIPSSVTKIGENAFDKSYDLGLIFIDDNLDWKSLKVENSKAMFKSIKYFQSYKCLSFEFNEDDKTAKITGLKTNKNSDFIFIPRTITNNEHEYIITEISEGSFEGSKSLNTVFIAPESEVKIIGKNSFTGSSLNKIIISPKVIEIGENAFLNCQKLLFVNFFRLASNLKIFNANSFANTSIVSIKIPGHVREICENAFSNCINLEFVNIISGVRIIGKNAFYNTKMAKIDIPNSVIQIKDGAFDSA